MSIENHPDRNATLYLIPTTLSDAPLGEVLPEWNIELVSGIRHYIVENIRTARRFLKRCDRSIDIDNITFHVLNVDTRPEEIPPMLAAMEHGEDVGVMSEAGCPAVADPGSMAVAYAQSKGWRVCPLVGPSSILMGLMGSGFNGQGFSFHGYLPIDPSGRVRKIKTLEEESRRSRMTQIFIETPYRNDAMLQTLASTLKSDTMLCVASAITDPQGQSIVTKQASAWRGCKHSYHKIPTIFLIYVP